VKFRSRLEARWAAFFSSLGWQWLYEPIDLKGYVPDFILKFYEPLLVEVKPVLNADDLPQYVPKIRKAGWKKEILIVGADLFEAKCWGDKISIGCLVDGESGGQGEGLLFRCIKCERISIFHDLMSYHCRVNGCYEGAHYLGGVDTQHIQQLWKDALNETRWKGTKLKEREVIS
jgi:hypothetical protein